MGFISDSIFESNRFFEDEMNESLLEHYLVEDRMVKYNGDLAPKFGWCVIYVGGPASGKGTATAFKSRLQGTYYNVDDLKEIERMWDIKPSSNEKTLSSNPGDLPGLRNRTSDDALSRRDKFNTPSEIVPKVDKDGNQVYDEKTGEPIYYDKYRNMGNSDFVSELHDAMKPLSKKWKKSILNNPENKGGGRDRLPNVIFDIVGDEVSKLSEIIEAMKPVGYKIAIIWMLSTIERAYRNNQMRDRVVDTDTIFIPKHRDVIKAQEELFSTGLISQVDEFWVIDTAVEVNPKTDPKAYHDEQNVYHIPCTKDGLKVFDKIASRIEYNKKELDRIEQKRKSI